MFGAKCPPISATKSLTGHSLGAAGVQEAIYSLLMMQNGFICESANIENLDPALADMPIVRERERQRQARLRAVELVRLRRHQRLGRVQAAGRIRVDGWHMTGSDEGQTRPDHGGRQRPLDRLGHRQDAGRRTAPSSPSPIQGEALGKRVKPLAESLGAKIVLPCDVEDIASVDAVFAELKKQWGTWISWSTPSPSPTRTS